MFADLLQQCSIDRQRKRASELAKRVDELERELDDTRELLRQVLVRLERHLGEDVDKDGKVG